MSNELIQNRKRKFLQANGGTYPLATQDPNLIPGFLNIFGIRSLFNLKDYKNPVVSLIPQDLPNQLYTIHGRIKNIRKNGSIVFIKIEDHAAAIQLILYKKVIEEETFKSFLSLDLGDIIEACGQICQTVAGETSLLVRKPIKLLSKALLPPPEKWVGLSDKEKIYKQRHLDLMSNEESRMRFKHRALMVRALRSYLDAQDFLEVETSMLQSLNSGANAKPFVTHHHAANKDLYLRIAPELNLKRLLVGGLDRVYEIGKSFRNEGVSSKHNPEFTMLEFYQAYASFEDLIGHCRNILSLCKEATSSYPWECSVDFTEIKQLTMLEAVQNSLWSRFGIRLDDNLSCVEDNFEKVHGLSIINNLLSQSPTFLSFGEKLFELFEKVAEPFLTQAYRNADGTKSLPVIITQYPAEICPLARKSDLDPRFCDRFEMYLNGIEVANGYQELNDPEEQKKRFEEQLVANKKDPMDLDSDYIEALSYGMPPAIGFGLGVDRIVMILTGAESIKDAILFPAI